MARVAVPVKNVPFFLKKITPKFVTEAMNQSLLPVEQIKLLELPRPVEPRHLYDLYGIIRVATIVADKGGTKADSVRFSGKLKAYTPPDANGEQFIFESGQTFIPVLDTYLYSALKSAQEAEPGAYLEVALSIGIKTADPTKPSMTGYEWEVQKLIMQEPVPDDPIERLRLEAKNQQLALAAPKPTPTEMPSAADTLKKESAPGVGATSAPASTSSGTSSSGSLPTGSLSTASSDPSPKHAKGRHASA
jgi:hypothetical protein